MTSVIDPYRRYLRILGIGRRPSGLEGLRDVVRRHLCRVPFENVSKLLLFGREGAGRVTTLEEFLDGIEHRDLGGTCYTSNPFLAELLRAVGYDADLLGADMSTPNVHTVVRVRIAPADYHVDVGYGAPFREPLRLDRVPHEIVHGAHRYVLDRNSAGDGYRMSVFSGGERLHGYAVHEPPRSPDFFKQTILDSYRPGKTFMSCLRITRFFEERAAELTGNTLTRFEAGGTTRTTLASMAELEAAVAGDLALPRCPIRTAVAVLQKLTGERLFGGS